MIDVVACLDALGVDMKRTGKNVARNDVNIDCPWCGADKHLAIHRQTGLLNCWVCNLDSGKYPSFTGLIMELENINYSDAKALVMQHLTDEEAATELWVRPRNTKLPKGAQPFDNPENREARDIAYVYLYNRGFRKRQIRQYKLMFTPLETGDDYSGRVIFPIFDNGVLASWTGRDYTGRSPIRYNNCRVEDSMMRVKELLYGIDDFKGKHCRLVEGPLDAITIGNTALCVFRAKISREQRKRLLSLGLDSISLIFDSGDGVTNAIKIAEDLSPFVSKIKVVELGAKDVAEAGQKLTLLAEKKTPYFVA